MDRKETAAGYLPFYLAQKGIDVSRKFTCLNPQHFDHTPSMVYDPRRNKCHCYSCGMDADVFDLISWDYNTSNFTDTLKIACDLFGISGDGSTREIPVIKKREEAKKSNELISIDIRDRVYRAFRDLCPLTPEDVKYLTTVRNIPEKRAKEGFFRTVTEDRERIIRRLVKLTGCGPDVLKDVPGFFMLNGKLDYYIEPGIGILIHDVNGKVSSVQVRRDTSDKGNRYCWFSSRFASGKPGYKGGSSPGSQKDVIIPANPKKMICITEGRFKAEILASYRNPVISVQGVSSWRGIDVVLKIMQERYGSNSVCLMFDADLMGNYQVLQNIERMVNTLHDKQPDLKILACIWPIRYGKGIDDCILSGNIGRVKYVNASAMLDVCTSTWREVLEKYKGDKEQLKDLLQQMNEAIFFGTPKAA